MSAECTSSPHTRFITLSLFGLLWLWVASVARQSVCDLVYSNFIALTFCCSSCIRFINAIKFKGLP